VKALFLESLPWESAFTVGSHHYAQGFLDRGWDVMWVSHPLSPIHFLRREKRDFDVRVRGWREGPIAYGNLLYYSPMTLLPTGNVPILSSCFALENSARLTVPSLRSVIAQSGFERPDLVWLTNPVFHSLARQVHGRALAVRVADDQAAFRDVPDSVRQAEDTAAKEADLVFAVSGRVFERLSNMHSGVVRLPNGVDYARFSEPASEPDDIRSLPHPRFIYVGATEYWFDVDAVKGLAKARPDASIIVVGPLSVHADALRGVENIHLLGPRPYASLPGYLQHSDVGIIPFTRDDMVDAIHPIKLYEYMAAGLPTVATDWPELESMHAPAMLAPISGFVEAAIEMSANPGDSRWRMDYARENSWESRVDVVVQAVDDVLATKS